ncbi:MAG: cytochrome P450 [Anaerolineales bacterium]
MPSEQQVVQAPHQHPLWGNLRAFQQDALATVEVAREAGDFVRWRFGPFWFYQANDPELVRQILVNQASQFHKTDRNKEVFRPVIGEGLLVSDGAFWRRQRTMVQPAFHTQRIRAYGDIMVEEANAMLQRWRDGADFELHHEMMRVTLAIVARTLFDIRLEDQDFQRVSEAMDVVLEEANNRFQSIIDIPRWVPTRSHRRSQEAIEVLDTVIHRIIEARRRSGEDRGDLLSILLFSEDDEGHRMTAKQVRDEAMTLFLAGHETTANALTWAWTLLSQHSDVLAELQREVHQNLGDRYPTVDDLEALKLHEQVINETMRLYPPVWIIARQSISEVPIGNYTLPEGARVFISAWGLHRDPSLFEDPLIFRPERFGENQSADRHKYAFIPFGGGPRICIGNAFAMMEAQLILATMVSQVEIELAPDQNIAPEPLVTLRPRDPIPISMQWRKQEAPPLPIEDRA